MNAIGARKGNVFARKLFFKKFKPPGRHQGGFLFQKTKMVDIRC